MTTAPGIDITRPNAARIYDAMLGGYHNFETDRAAAARLAQIAPKITAWARLNRCFLQVVSQQLATSGLSHFVDLATGLPTQGYIHEVLPAAKVIYSDNDPITVAYARDILGDKANVRYIAADATEPSSLLHAPELHDVFGDERRVGFFCVGISYFLSDQQLGHTLDALYRWAAPGSALALSVISVPPGGLSPAGVAVQEQYRRMGVNIVYRTMEQVQAVVGAWKPDERGWRYLHAWPGVDAEDIFEPDELAEGGMQCAVLWK